jgi:hypothetical protein
VIFDLKSGKRRRVVQVVFGLLAAIFLISFVGFGIGSNAAGGIFDALGIGGGSSGSGGDTQYDQQIEDAEKTLETNPDNQRALLDLLNYHYLAATQSGIESDPQTGQTSISEDSHSQLEDAVQAWQDYLATKPAKPDDHAAASASQAYVLLNDAGGAAEAQQIVADSTGSAAAYGQLALYLYADGKIKEGDAAGEQAIKAADPSQRAQIKKNMDQLAEAARKQQRQIEHQAQQGGEEAGESQLQNPFGGLGGGSTVPPTTPTP